MDDRTVEGLSARLDGLARENERLARSLRVGRWTALAAVGSALALGVMAPGWSRPASARQGAVAPSPPGGAAIAAPAPVEGDVAAPTMDTPLVRIGRYYINFFSIDYSYVVRRNDGSLARVLSYGPNNNLELNAEESMTFDRLAETRPRMMPPGFMPGAALPGPAGAVSPPQAPTRLVPETPGRLPAAPSAPAAPEAPPAPR